MEHDDSLSASGLGGWLGGEVLRTRTILMFGELTPALLQNVSRQALLLAARSGEDIKLLVNAHGGQASDGLALLDVLRGLEPRVLVIGAGTVANAAALAFVAPPRAQRFCLPHARFALGQHFDAGQRFGAGVDLTAGAAAIRAQREQVSALFARQMGQPVETVAGEIERQDWLDAEEALAHGLVERIVRSAEGL